MVAAREEAGDGAGVVVLVVPEVRELAVGQEDERCTERLCIGERLLLGDVGVDCVSLGLDHGKRSASLVVEDVVGSAGCGDRRGEVENGYELADDVQISFGIGREDKIAKRGIGIQRLESNLAMAPAAVRGGALRALVFLDRELAPECGIGRRRAAIPARVCLGGCHRARTGKGSGSRQGWVGSIDRPLTRATKWSRVRRTESGTVAHPISSPAVPTIRSGPKVPAAASRSYTGAWVSNGRALDRWTTGPVAEESAACTSVPTIDLSSGSHPALPQPVVDGDSRVRFGMTSGHPESL